jgi:hypothetical protein
VEGRATCAILALHARHDGQHEYGHIKEGAAMTNTIIGRVRFVRGTERDVYLDRNGRQYVIGYHGELVYGTWVLTEEAEA